MPYRVAKKIEYVNPYNFITLPDNKVTRTNAEINTEKLHTGYLDCILVNKTPIIIPDADRKETMDIPNVKDHYRYPFFRIGDKPIIPGSSIRGVLRSAYEAVTNSCMSTAVTNDFISTRTVTGEHYCPGLLIREKDKNGIDTWKLYEANRIALVCNDFADGKRTGYREFKIGGYSKFKSGIDKSGERFIYDTKNSPVYNGEKVWFDVGNEYEKTVKGKLTTIWNETVYSFQKDLGQKEKDMYEGYLAVGELIGNKHAESVFEKKDELRVEDMDALMRGLENTVMTYRDESINSKYNKGARMEDKDYHLGYPGYERAKGSGVIPIWYYKEQTRYGDIVKYVSPAAIGRYTFNKSMTELQGDNKACADRKNVCKGCNLFGMVADGNKNFGLGSRIRVTDADMVEGEPFETETFTLRELGSPRPSYTPFYSKDGSSFDKSGIRGRKFYWHNKNVSLKSIKSKANNMNADFEVLKNECRFSFKLYYDGITTEQLEELKWVITLGTNDDKDTHMHKIGHGKPLGLGSVKINILRQTEREYASESLLYNISVNEKVNIQDVDSLNSTAKAELLIISDMNSLGNTKIDYPYIEYNPKDKEVWKDNDIARHQCYSRYKNPSKSKGENKVKLPDIMETKNGKRLNPYEITEDDSQSYGGYNNRGNYNGGRRY